jgi:hypothetical protein
MGDHPHVALLSQLPRGVTPILHSLMDIYGALGCLFFVFSRLMLKRCSETISACRKLQLKCYLYIRPFVAPWQDAGYGKSVSETLAELRNPKDRHAVRFYSEDGTSSVHERHLESATVDIILILSTHLPLLNVE